MSTILPHVEQPVYAFTNKKTLSLAEMSAKILYEQSGKKDMVLDTRNMSLTQVENKPSLFAGDDFFDINDHFHGQLAAGLNVPKRYYDKMRKEAPALLVENVNHWLHETPSTQMVRTTHGVARAYLSDRFRRLDNVDIIKQVFPIFHDVDGIQFHQASITDTRLYLRAVVPSMSVEIRKGETIQWGIEIGNSEVGSGAVSVKSFLLNLICLNGMTMEKLLSKHHLGKRLDESLALYQADTLEADDHAFFLQLRDTVQGALSEAAFNSVVSTIQNAANSTLLSNVIPATTTLGQKYALSAEETNNILNNLITGGDLSAWGLANAVTDAAKATDGFDRQAALEALGGEIVNLSASEWDVLALAR